MEMNTPYQIEHLKTDNLIPYAMNARTHSEEQVAQIAASIREFGFTNPVLIDKEGTIVAGHGRVRGARKLGLETVPCIRLGHLSPAQVRAYVIADNKIALNAGWDFAMLENELRTLNEEGFEMVLTGFTDAELQSLLMEKQVGENPAEEHWKGMPEFEDPEPCFRKVVVNFDSEEDVRAFFKAIGQDFTENTKSIWYPHKERRNLADKRWATDVESLTDKEQSQNEEHEG